MLPRREPSPERLDLPEHRSGHPRSAGAARPALVPSPASRAPYRRAPRSPRCRRARRRNSPEPAAAPSLDPSEARSSGRSWSITRVWCASLPRPPPPSRPPPLPPRPAESDSESTGSEEGQETTDSEAEKKKTVVSVCVCTTSRHTEATRLGQLALFSIMLPSLRDTLRRGAPHSARRATRTRGTRGAPSAARAAPARQTPRPAATVESKRLLRLSIQFSF